MWCMNNYINDRAVILKYFIQLPCSRTVFPAPLGPTRTVRGVKNEMTCLSLSSIPKLLTPRMLILSILDMFAFCNRKRENNNVLNQQQWSQKRSFLPWKQMLRSNSSHLRIQWKLHGWIVLSLLSCLLHDTSIMPNTQHDGQYRLP